MGRHSGTIRDEYGTITGTSAALWELFRTIPVLIGDNYRNIMGIFQEYGAVFPKFLQESGSTEGNIPQNFWDGCEWNRMVIGV